MAVQYCAICGEPVIAGERFCGNCGRDVTIPGSVSNAPPLRQGIPPIAPIHQQGYDTAIVKPKQGSPLPLIISVVVILLILAVGGYFLLANKGSNNTANNQANIVPTITPGSAVVVNPTSTPASVIVNPTSLPASPVVNPTDTASNVVVTNPTDTPASAVGNATDTPNQELSTTIATMNSLIGFHAKFTGTISNTSVTLDGDFSKAGASYAGQVNNQVFDAIYVNNSGYISTDRGKTWGNDTQNLTRYASQVYDLLNNISIGNGDTVDYGSPTTLQDGTPAHQLRITESLNVIQITMQTVDLHGKRAVAHLQYYDSGSRIQATIDYSKFNEVVNITAPNLTK